MLGPASSPCGATKPRPGSRRSRLARRRRAPIQSRRPARRARPRPTRRARRRSETRFCRAPSRASFALALDPGNDEAKFNLELALQRARGIQLTEGAGGVDPSPGGAARGRRRRRAGRWLLMAAVVTFLTPLGGADRSWRARSARCSAPSFDAVPSESDGVVEPAEPMHARRASRSRRALLAAAALIGVAAAQPVLEQTTRDVCVRMRRCSSSSTCLARCSRSQGRARPPESSAPRRSRLSSVRRSRTSPSGIASIHGPGSPAPLPERGRRCLPGDARQVDRHREASAAA